MTDNSDTMTIDLTLAQQAILFKYYFFLEEFHQLNMVHTIQLLCEPPGACKTVMVQNGGGAVATSTL